jgi:hypothetical protein
MLNSKIIDNKNSIPNKFGKIISDLIYSTFKFPKNIRGTGVAMVNEYENMRPDLVADRIYGSQGKWDVMLKYNGISNPFSLEFGTMIHILNYQAVDIAYSQPRSIKDREEKVETEAGGITKPTKDKDRLANIANKNKQRIELNKGPNGELPPNINKPGDKNIKVRDGRVVFGEDVTTLNKDNCPVPISRARLQAALLKDKLFL